MSAPIVEGGDGQGEARQMSKPSLLAILPTELIDRILDEAIFGLSKRSTTASLSASLRFHEACKIALVCQMFHLLARPKMYKQVSVSIRQMPSFLSTIQNTKEIARCIKEMTLEGRIWTDIDQDVVVGILLAVRETCVRVRLGANESLLLPYLLHGSPAESDTNQEQGEEKACALQVLNICWRDEVQVQSQWQHLNLRDVLRRHQDAADTLYNLFQHKLQGDDSIKTPPTTSRQQSLPNLTHLTLDLYSQSQLDQIFDSTGYFVKMILPKLRFLRIEMPYVVLQFTCERAGDLVQGWPKDDWITNPDAETVQEAIEIRQDQTRRVDNDQQERLLQEDMDMIMPYCPANQLKSLTLRFLLNVHRNDMMLFKLTCPVKALEQSWSTRASVAAHCLSSTMQMYLNSNDQDSDINEDRTSRICSFPFAHYKSKGAEVYWKQKWIEAEEDSNASLPTEIRATTSFHQGQIDDTNLGSTKVSLLLKWPHAVDAFFHYSAMI